MGDWAEQALPKNHPMRHKGPPSGERVGAETGKAGNSDHLVDPNKVMGAETAMSPVEYLDRYYQNQPDRWFTERVAAYGKYLSEFNVERALEEERSKLQMQVATWQNRTKVCSRQIDKIAAELEEAWAMVEQWKDRFNGAVKVSLATEAERDRLKEAAKADDERLRTAAERTGVGYFGCDTAEHLADEILELRAFGDRLKETNESLGKTVVALQDKLAQWQKDSGREP